MEVWSSTGVMLLGGLTTKTPSTRSTQALRIDEGAGREKPVALIGLGL